MTGATLLAVLAEPGRTTFDVLSMDVVVVALAREISCRMAVKTAWVFEYWND